MIVNGNTKEFFGKREKGWLELVRRSGCGNWKYISPENRVHKSECQANIRELVHNHSFSNCIKKFWLVMRHQPLQPCSVFRSQMMAAVVTENEISKLPGNVTVVSSRKQQVRWVAFFGMSIFIRRYKFAVAEAGRNHIVPQWSFQREKRFTDHTFLNTYWCGYVIFSGSLHLDCSSFIFNLRLRVDLVFMTCEFLKSFFQYNVGCQVPLEYRIYINKFDRASFLFS